VTPGHTVLILLCDIYLTRHIIDQINTLVPLFHLVNPDLTMKWGKILVHVSASEISCLTPSSEDYRIPVTLKSNSTYSTCLISSPDQFRVGLPWRTACGAFGTDRMLWRDINHMKFKRHLLLALKSLVWNKWLSKLLSLRCQKMIRSLYKWPGISYIWISLCMSSRERAQF
jgi:hypothetical protein